MYYNFQNNMVENMISDQNRNSVDFILPDKKHMILKRVFFISLEASSTYKVNCNSSKTVKNYEITF